jgi:hypothetical protein
MFATFILVLQYRYDRITTSMWILYPRILLGEGYTLVDYSVAKKCQQLQHKEQGMVTTTRLVMFRNGRTPNAYEKVAT